MRDASMMYTHGYIITYPQMGAPGLEPWPIGTLTPLTSFDTTRLKGLHMLTAAARGVALPSSPK